MIDRRLDDFKGPKTLEEWIDVYERRAGDDVHFQLEPHEEIVWWTEHGFFTFWPDLEKRRLDVPKMCGDGRFLRRKVWEAVKALEHLGFRSVYLCSRHRPEVYLRVIGGRFDKMKKTVNLNTGRLEPLYFYEVTLDDTKEGKAGCTM